LRLVNPNTNAGGEGEGLYWRYENVLKMAEGMIHTVIGANGAIYAIRREHFSPLPGQAVIMDDFLIPLRVLKHGQRVIYDPEAVAVENTSPDMRGEFTRKVRIAAANFNVIPHILGLLNPFRGFAALALWSHKIVRWSVPFLALGALVTNLFAVGTGWVYTVGLGLQLFIYIGAILGYLGDRLFGRSGPLMPFYYLVTMNLAIFLGFWRSLARTQKIAWERVQH
jgi:cellulose synthase/poly-beta-1,6-N-acetylglucosamine synthase-like glycosyltransferase